MNRSLVVVAVAFVACIALVPALVATDASAQQNGNVTAIDSCTNITEPGEYELVEDIQSDEADTCIGIQADDVVLDGNGHVLEGPGRDEGSIAIDYSSDGRNTDLEIRNVEIAGWHRVVSGEGSYDVANTVIRDNVQGLDIGQGEVVLTDVVIENNDGWGITAIQGGASGTNVTIRENGAGISGLDPGDFRFESSRIVDNDGTGANVGHFSSLNLTDSTVSGNDGHGIKSTPLDFYSRISLENTTVADNAGDGIRAPGETTVQLDDVTVENNAGLAVNTYRDEDWHSSPGSVTAANLAVGPSATVTVDAGPLRVDPVDRGDLQPRDDGTLVGDGLNVTTNVSGVIELELDVETEDETVDLWRHDGSEWQTVDENLSVTDGTIEASVDENGTYAPGTTAEEQESSETDQDDSDESDNADESSDDEADDSERSDDSDTSEDDSQDDADRSDDTDETDDDSQDGSDETDGSNESDGTEESDDEETGDEGADTSDETDDSDSSDDQETDDEETEEEADDSRDESGESDDDQSSDEESTDEGDETGDDETEAGETDGDETTDESTDDDESEADDQTESSDDEAVDDESADDDPETGDDGGAAIADDQADTLTPEVPESDPLLGEEGPGFGVIAALVAVVSAGLLANLRREI